MDESSEYFVQQAIVAETERQLLALERSCKGVEVYDKYVAGMGKNSKRKVRRDLRNTLSLA